MCRCSRSTEISWAVEPFAGLDRGLAGHGVQHVVEQIAAVGLPSPDTNHSSKACKISPGFMLASIAGKPVIKTVSPPNGSILRPSSASTSRCSRAMAASAGLKSTGSGARRF